MKLGEAREYHELVAIIRARTNELGTTMEVVDEVAGLPTRYTSKVFAPMAIKILGKVSLGAILGALCVKLTVETDDEQLAKIRHRLTPRKNVRRPRDMLARGRGHVLKNNSELARHLQHRWAALTTRRQRRRWALQGAQARWGSRA